MNVEELVAAYVKTRDQKTKLKAEYDASVAKIDAVQAKIEGALLLTFKSLGVDSVKTPAGTAYRSTRSSASMADWDSFKNFCQQQEDPYEYLDRRVNKAAVEAYKEQHQALPPGVNWSESVSVNFRRA